MAFDSSKFEPVVVVGGGFAGLTTAIALSQCHPRPQVFLIEPRKRFVFSPFLYELLSGELKLWEVAPTYKSLLVQKGISLIEDSVEVIDTNLQKVITNSGISLKYSQVVICTGSRPNDFSIKGVKDYALTFHTLQDVERMKRLIYQLKFSSDEKKSLVIVGAGATGIELACKVYDLLGGGAEIHLVDVNSQVLRDGKSFNKERSHQALTNRGIKLHLKTRVDEIGANTVYLETFIENKLHKFEIKHSGIVWTAGTKPNVPKLIPELSSNTGPLVVDNLLQVIGLNNVFAFGDVAFHEREPWPQNAQVAFQQAKLGSQIIMDMRMGKPISKFTFVDFGEMLGLGIGNATITGLGLAFQGPLAFHIRRMTYLSRMPGFALGMRSACAWFLGN